MNRLWVRLTLAFVLVTLGAVGAAAAFANWSATQAFGSYVARQTEFVQSGRLEELADYYAATGSWAGVEALLNADAPVTNRGRNRPPLLLADATAQVIFDERGQRAGGSLSPDERGRALAITSQGRAVGYVVFNAPEGGAFTPSQQAFLTQLQIALSLAALLAAALSIGVGIVVSRWLAAPLAQVAAASRGLAARDWARRAPVAGADEVAEVGRAFNAMADSLQQAEALRRSLMADIAHELRTPLTVMQGNLRAILDGVYPLEVTEVATLYDETRLLSRLVDDLRELAVAEAGQLSLHYQALQPVELLKRLRSEFAPGADAAQIVLELHLPPELQPVRGDADRVAQVLRNLVANALRHTPAGGQVTVSASNAAEACVRFEVGDTGEGIPEVDQPHVFERFYRGANTRASGGTGLGLAIARAWIEAMGGEIGVDSVAGQGSRFWFTLPLNSSAPR